MQIRLPDRTKSVWFTPPRTGARARQYLGLGVATSGLEIVLLAAKPPISPADHLVQPLVDFLSRPWEDDDSGELALDR
jgi:hypothetical protein